MNRPWEIWLVHHTHVDIGYTEPQEIILRKHAEFIAQALDYCTATDALPAGERFCWTCEVSWTVKAFLARYPERVAEFFRRVREGRIEVTALYLQLTDLFTEELLEATTDYAFTLARQHEFDIVTAMNDDVNGWAWGLPDLLAKRGVRFMDTAINETRALGVRPRPAMFRWTGPQGGSLLFWHSHGYLCGNSLGLEQGEADERVASLLRGLEDGGYPHHVVEARIHGENHDNAPPGLWLCDAVRRWNAAHPAGPRLRLVTARQWFEQAAANWPVALTEHRAGWPDWWADGNGSAAAESALVRQAQADLVTLDALAAATGRPPPADRVERARDAAAFFCEHTWGAWCSTDQPDSLTTKAQWNTKAGFAYTAAVEARSLIEEQLAAETSPGILVFNPLDHARTDFVELVVIEHKRSQVMAPVRQGTGPAFHLVDEAAGVAVPVEREPAIATSARWPAQKIRFLACDVPARGFRRYRQVAGDCPVADSTEKIVLSDCGIVSIGDWFTASGEYRLGEVIYETIPGPFGREKLCGWDGIRRDTPFVRTPMRFGDSLTLEVTTELDRVDLRYRLKKPPTTEAEAIYVVFPFRGTVFLDVPGGALRPGLDQVPGTATDWHSVQHFFAVEDKDRTIVVASPDIPLVQVNGINTGKWQETLPPPTGLVMSWVMNNYWFTNFPAAQGGEFVWRYSLRVMPGGFDREAALRFARTIRQPLVGVATP